MPLWLLELFCPEHGLPILLEAYRRYWSVWRVAMAWHVREKLRVVGWFRGA